MGLLLTTPPIKKLGFPLRGACLIHGAGRPRVCQLGCLVEGGVALPSCFLFVSASLAQGLRQRRGGMDFAQKGRAGRAQRGNEK